MDDILIAVDESTSTSLVTAAQNALGTQSRSGNGNLGPFNANWTASAGFSGGSVDLREPNIVGLQNVTLNFSVGIGFSIDLSDILPDFCLPRVCIRIPFVGRVCTPRICIDWPTINIGPINHSGNVNFTADFSALASTSGSDWKVEIQIVDIPNLQLDAISSIILVGITSAVALALLAVPFIGPILAAATALIGAAIGVAAITGLLGPILSLFLAGLSFEIYRQPQIQTVLPSAGANDPDVKIRIDSLAAEVQSSDEDELVLTANVSPA